MHTLHLDLWLTLSQTEDKLSRLMQMPRVRSIDRSVRGTVHSVCCEQVALRLRSDAVSMSFTPRHTDAAHLAKALGKPVLPIARRNSITTPSGRQRWSESILALKRRENSIWNYDVACAGERGSQQFYTIPHLRTVSRDAAPGEGRCPSMSGGAYISDCQ
jgi:hypothetical protein